MTPIINPMFTPNVNQAQINRAIFMTADPANKAEFIASLDGSVRNILQDPTLSPQEKSTQALAIQQQRTLDLLS